MEDSSLSTVKSELTALGLSVSTPGLVGDARYEELLRRLLAAQQELSAANDIIGIQNAANSIIFLSSA